MAEHCIKTSLVAAFVIGGRVINEHNWQTWLRAAKGKEKKKEKERKLHDSWRTSTQYFTPWTRETRYRFALMELKQPPCKSIYTSVHV